MQKSILIHGIVYQNIFCSHPIFANLYHPQFAFFEYDALVAVVAENHGFAVLEENLAFFPGFRIRNGLVNAIIKDHTILKHLYHGGALELGCLFKNFLGVFQVVVDATRKKRTSGTKNKLSGYKRIFDGTHGRSFSNKTPVGSG